MQRGRKQTRQDSVIWKRFMDIILSQLPPLVKKYPPNDQILLKEFLAIFQNYKVEIQANRDAISQKFENFLRKYRNSEEYLHLPFLWFAIEYLENANRLLSVSQFYANNYYEYIVQKFRGDTQTPGFFQLVRDSTPLTDLAWEQLQYTCARLRDPLTRDELNILEAVFSYMTEVGFKACNQRALKAAITESVKIPRLSRNLARFFTILAAQWELEFYPPAFGEEQLYFHFQLKDSTPLMEVIDFQNPNNSILCTSNVYRVRGFQNTYIGRMMVPTQVVNQLRIYLEECEQQELLILYELTSFTQQRKSTSFALYKVEKGWRAFSLTKWRQIVKSLQTQHPRKKRSSKQSFFITPIYSNTWSYKKYNHPFKLISLLCKSPFVFSFDELPLGSTDVGVNFRLSSSELNILKELFRHQAIQLNFRPVRLIQEYSLNTYWIKLPKIPLEQLSRLLAWLPFSQLFFTEMDIHMWTYLTPNLAHWLRTDLKWVVRPIVLNHYRQNLTIDWFNPETLKWRTPFVLKKLTE